MHFYLLLFLFLFSNSGEEAFCSCRQQVEITQEDIEDYDLILRGIVQKIDTVDHKKMITFQMKELYKGSTQNELVTVSTPLDLSLCGLNIGIEGEWLLFAYKRNGGYSTNSCSRSGMIDSSVHHIKERVKLDLNFLENLNE